MHDIVELEVGECDVECSHDCGGRLQTRLCLFLRNRPGQVRRQIVSGQTLLNIQNPRPVTCTQIVPKAFMIRVRTPIDDHNFQLGMKQTRKPSEKMCIYKSQFHLRVSIFLLPYFSCNFTQTRLKDFSRWIFFCSSVFKMWNLVKHRLHAPSSSC